MPSAPLCRRGGVWTAPAPVPIGSCRLMSLDKYMDEGLLRVVMSADAPEAEAPLALLMDEWRS